MDGPQTYRRNTMPVEMIELEEVTLVETMDEALEVVVGRASFWTMESC